jgi:hypothetical protein
VGFALYDLHGSSGRGRLELAPAPAARCGFDDVGNGSRGANRRVLRDDRPIVTENFLQRFDVRYIIVGSMSAPCTARWACLKFEEWNGILWDEVYRDGATVIYRVRIICAAKEIDKTK